MKDALQLIGVLVAMVAFFYVLENTDRFARIADKSLDRVEYLVSPKVTKERSDRVPQIGGCDE